MAGDVRNLAKTIPRWYSTEQDFSSIAVPVFSIVGDLLETDIEGGASVGIEYIVMKNSGHFNMLEDPDRFNEMLSSVIHKIINSA